MQITNYDAAYTWAGTATASGLVAISNTGLVTVTNVAAGTSSIATITATRTGYNTGSAPVTATSLTPTPSRECPNICSDQNCLKCDTSSGQCISYSPCTCLDGSNAPCICPDGSNLPCRCPDGSNSPCKCSDICSDQNCLKCDTSSGLCINYSPCICPDGSNSPCLSFCLSENRGSTTFCSPDTIFCDGIETDRDPNNNCGCPCIDIPSPYISRQPSIKMNEN